MPSSLDRIEVFWGRRFNPDQLKKMRIKYGLPPQGIREAGKGRRPRGLSPRRWRKINPSR